MCSRFSGILEGSVHVEQTAVVDTFDRLKDEVGVPLDVFVNWEEVWAHLELGNDERALGIVKNQKGRIEWEGRHRTLTALRVLYEEGRAHELLGETAEAAAAYEKLVDQLGDALAEVPRLADAPSAWRGCRADRRPGGPPDDRREGPSLLAAPVPALPKDASLG
jgi:hypothetical protein